jgi:hypothetical protein
VISRRSKSFVDLLAELSPEVAEQAKEACRVWSKNQSHPGLRFKKIQNLQDVWSVRVSRNYRAVGAKDGNTIVWFWIGSHAEYDQLLKVRRR